MLTGTTTALTARTMVQRDVDVRRVRAHFPRGGSGGIAPAPRRRLRWLRDARWKRAGGVAVEGAIGAGARGV